MPTVGEGVAVTTVGVAIAVGVATAVGEGVGVTATVGTLVGTTGGVTGGVTRTVGLGAGVFFICVVGVTAGSLPLSDTVAVACLLFALTFVFPVAAALTVEVVLQA